VNDELDPPRLSASSDGALERRLAGLVEASRADVGTPEQLARLEASLLPFIGPPGPAMPASPSGGGTASVGATAGMKATAIAVAVVAAAGGGLWLHSTRTPRVVQPVEQRAPVSPPAIPVEPTVPAPSVVAEAPAEASAAAPAPAEPTASLGNSGASRDKPALSEPELLGQAQGALSGNPARALALCETHRKLFPHGVLVQEREVLAIEALDKLGRHAQAVDRGNRFLKAFPSSAHRSKIVGIVGPR
jgi:hypothetical protein